MSASLPPPEIVAANRGASYDQADGFSERPEKSLVLYALEQMGMQASGVAGTGTPKGAVTVPEASSASRAEECLYQARQQTLFDRLENIVDGIPAAERPGHGLVVTHTIPRLSDAEHGLAGGLLRHGEQLSQGSGDIEIIKFKISDNPGDSRHCFFVYNPGVFAGLQISLSDDDSVTTAGGASDVGAALAAIDEIEQRLRLRAEISRLSYHGSVP